MSEGDLERMDSRPRGMSASEEERCDCTWERRWRAGALLGLGLMGEEWGLTVGHFGRFG